jgi:hypothetical protein
MLKFIKRTILPELRGSEMTTAEFGRGEAPIIKKIVRAPIPKTFFTHFILKFAVSH